MKFGPATIELVQHPVRSTRSTSLLKTASWLLACTFDFPHERYDFKHNNLGLRTCRRRVCWGKARTVKQLPVKYLVPLIQVKVSENYLPVHMTYEESGSVNENKVCTFFILARHWYGLTGSGNRLGWRVSFSASF